jgi:hypothetical protein
MSGKKKKKKRVVTMDQQSKGPDAQESKTMKLATEIINK